MPGITHLVEFQRPALQALVNLTEENAQATFADTYLPSINTFDRRFAYDIVRTNQYIAAYIGFGAEPPVMDRNEVANRMGEIAYFGIKDIVTYEELQAIHEARNNDEKRNVVDAITRKNVDLLDALRRLMYVAKMEALFKGAHTYVVGEKNQITFDFGVPAENKVALVPGADFEAPDFDVLGWLIEQHQAYKDANQGKAPEILIGSSKIRSLLQKHPIIITEAGRPEGSTRVSVEQLNEVLRSFDLLPITVYDERTVTVKDLETGANKTIEVMPENRLTFLSRGIGNYLVGPTLENNFRPGLYLEAKDRDEPIRSILRAVGAGFPAPSNPFLIYHMDVYTP